MPDSSQDLVLLTTCRDTVESMGIRAMLESEGIEVLVQGEQHRALEGPLLGAAIELRVMVRRRDLSDARELLEEAEYAEHLPPDEPESEPTDDASIQRFQAREDSDDRSLAEAGPDGLSPRRPGLAVALAIFLPIGAGHLYARRTAMGIAIAIMQLACWVVLFRGGHAGLALLGLIVIDAMGSSVAIRRDAARAQLPA